MQRDGRSSLTTFVRTMSTEVKALASGILEYEDIPDEDGDGIMDKGAYRGERGAGEMSAASQLFGFGR